jgi:hypothetical protein
MILRESSAAGKPDFCLKAVPRISFLDGFGCLLAPSRLFSDAWMGD